MYAGKKLRQLRQGLDLTQTEFAEALGLSQSYYSSVEAGKRKITPKMIEKINAKWKVDQGYFKKITESQEEEYFTQLFQILPEETKMKHFGNFVLSKGGPNLIYMQKFSEDLKHESPELAELLYLLSELSTFSIDLEKISTTYIEPVFSKKEINAKNYSDYKKKNINHLGKFLHFKEVVKPVVVALRKFIEEDFPPLDAKGVLLAEEEGLNYPFMPDIKIKK